MSAKHGKFNGEMGKYLDSAIKYNPNYYEAYKEKSSIGTISLYERMMGLRKMMELDPSKDGWVWRFEFELLAALNGIFFF